MDCFDQGYYTSLVILKHSSTIHILQSQCRLCQSLKSYSFSSTLLYHSHMEMLSIFELFSYHHLFNQTIINLLLNFIKINHFHPHSFIYFSIFLISFSPIFKPLHHMLLQVHFFLQLPSQTILICLLTKY